MAQVGVSDLYYAVLTKDDGTGVTYNTPVKIPGLISINIKPNSSTETLFGDNGPMETASTLGNIQVEINTADIDFATQAVLLGHTLNGSGILLRKSTDIPPWVAIGFKALKSNGKYRYGWLVKGKFAIPDMDNTTRKDSIDFQTPTINGSFVKRDNDALWLRQTDEDAVGYTAATGTNWFTTVG